MRRNRSLSVTVGAVLTALSVAACGGSGGRSDTVTVTAPSPAAATAAPDPAALQSAIAQANGAIGALDAVAPASSDKARSPRLSVPASVLGATDLETMSNFIAYVANDNDRLWEQVFKRAGRTWTPDPKVVTLTTGTQQSDCDSVDGYGPGTLGEPNADTAGEVLPLFYCDQDDTLYFDVPWILKNAFALHTNPEGNVAGGDFAVAYLVAHQVAHALQWRLGWKLPPNALAVRPRELQADCIAGVWANTKWQDKTISPGDLAEGLAAAEAAGDRDWVSFAHGGFPFERKAAFQYGYDTGNVGKCTMDLHFGTADINGNPVTTSTAAGGTTGAGDTGSGDQTP
jgi:predicted metalloprotease